MLNDLTSCDLFGAFPLDHGILRIIGTCIEAIYIKSKEAVPGASPTWQELNKQTKSHFEKCHSDDVGSLE